MSKPRVARQPWRLARGAVRGWLDDSAPSMGAALAFYVVLALSPLLLVAMGVAGLLAPDGDALIALVARLAGDNAAFGVEALLDGAPPAGQALAPALVGLAGAMIGAATVFAELRADLDRIWHHDAHEAGGTGGLLAARILCFLLLVAAGALLLASMGASLFLAAAPLRLRALELVASLAAVALAFAAIYKLVPSRQVAWSDVWPGAAVASAFFYAGKSLAALYVSRAALDSSFAAAGALVVLVLWVYYSSQVFFLGAELTREHAQRRGPRRLGRRRKSLAQMNADYETLAKRIASRVSRSRWITSAP